MSALDRAIERAKSRDARVVFPELEDPRVAGAARELSRQGICDPAPLGQVSEAHVAALVQSRGLKEPIARRMLSKPLYLADAMVAGADAPTRRVIEAASIGIGLSEGVTLPSSFFLMLFPDGREMVFADCAVNVAPDAEGLAAIARASERTASALLGQARVALLSFSTGTSGAGDSVEMVRAAAETTGFIGPVQADAALNPAIAAKN